MVIQDVSSLALLDMTRFLLIFAQPLKFEQHPWE